MLRARWWVTLLANEMEVTAMARARVATQEAVATLPDSKLKVHSCPWSVSASAHTRDHKMTTCICHQGHPLVPVTVQMRSIDVNDNVKESKSNLQNISWTQKGKRAYHADMWAHNHLGTLLNASVRSSDLCHNDAEDWKSNLEISVERQRSKHSPEPSDVVKNKSILGVMATCQWWWQSSRQEMTNPVKTGHCVVWRDSGPCLQRVLGKSLCNLWQVQLSKVFPFQDEHEKLTLFSFHACRGNNYLPSNLRSALGRLTRSPYCIYGKKRSIAMQAAFNLEPIGWAS